MFFFLISFSPSFEVLEVWLESLAMHISVGHPLPPDLVFDIENYRGSQSRESSLSSTPDDLNGKTPRLDNSKTDGLITSPTLNDNSKIEHNNDINKKHYELVSESIDEVDFAIDNKNKKTTLNIELKGDVSDIPSIATAQIGESERIENSHSIPIVVSTKDIPKSPHLSKDFSPNGDRIRDSIRARRQQRMMKNRENQRKSFENDNSTENSAPSSLTDDSYKKSSSEPVSLVNNNNSSKMETETDRVLIDVRKTLDYNKKDLLTRKESKIKSRPYGEKGFIINMKDGLLNLNNVKDLDNCSDFDSSCDTSLNYIEVNAPLLPPPSPSSTSNQQMATAVVKDSVRDIVNRFDEKILTSPKSPSLKPLSDRDLWNTTPPTHIVVKKIEVNDNKSNENNTDKKPAKESLFSSFSRFNLLRHSTDGKSPKAEEKTYENLTPHQRSYKNTLDDIRTKLNLYKSRLDSIDNASKDNLTNSQNSMKNYFKLKSQDSTDSEKTEAIKPPGMFKRLPVSPESEVLQPKQINTSETIVECDKSTKPTSGAKKATTRLFRVNETPIFERKTMRSMLPGNIFRRSDSEEKIPKSTFYTPASPPSQCEKSTYASKQKVSPTSDLKPNYIFTNSSQPDHNNHNRNSTNIIKYNNSNNNVGVHQTITKRGTASSDNKTNEKAPMFNQSFFNFKRINYPSPQPTRTNSVTSNQQNNLENSQKHERYVTLSSLETNNRGNNTHRSNKTNTAITMSPQKTNKINVLSPNTIRKLNAKLTESKYRANSLDSPETKTYNNATRRSSQSNNNLRNNLQPNVTTHNHHQHRMMDKIPPLPPSQSQNSSSATTRKTSTSSSVLESTAL